MTEAVRTDWRGLHVIHSDEPIDEENWQFKLESEM